MQKSKAAAILAGINPTQRPAASAPTNLHVMSGEVVATSEDGQVAIKMPGMLFGDDDDQCIAVDTLGGLEEGDTATVLLAGESGKGMSPMAIGGVGNIDRIVERVVQTEHLIAEKADISDLEANYAHITEGVIDNATIGYADVDGLSANYATIGNLNSATARINTLETNTADIATIRANSAKVANLTAQQLSAATAYIASLTADSITAASLSADIGKIHILTADELGAAAAYIASLTAGNVTAANLIADHGDFDTVKANAAKVANLTAQQLEADHAKIGTLDTTYMHADMSNSDVAWISNGTIANGAISSAMINDVSANKLTAGTINGSVINVTNLNADNITAGTINGQRIGTGSLSLDKLSEDVYTESEVDAKLSTMQAEIDGAIETWTGTAVPTLSNAPASDWTTNAIKDTHVGDVYFVVNSQSQQNGYNYRFTKSGGTYSWQLIKDNDVTNALQRLTTAEGKITTFDSDISQLKTDTGTLTTKTTSLETRMSDAENDILDKVDTTTFNEVSDTVDQHTQTITQHTTAISNKADNSTVTAVTNRVSKNEQDISGINTTIGALQTTVESKADGSTVTTISNKLNQTADTVDGHTSQLTSVTAKMNTVANPNLSPFFSLEPDDVYNATSNPDGYWDGSKATYVTKLSDGWAHYVRNNTGSGNVWLTIYEHAAWRHKHGDLKGNTKYTVLMEFRNVVVSGNVTCMGITTHATSWPSMFTSTVPKETVADGSFYHVGTTIADPASLSGSYTTTRSLIECPAGSSIECDFRISLYEGEYSGPYKPYVDQALRTNLTSLQTDYATYKQTTTENVSIIGTRLTTAEGKISTAESNITQNAQNIALKVSKNDVINQINVSTEGATISASKVNIEGAAIFSSGRLSQTSLNNAYDAKGAADTANNKIAYYNRRCQVGQSTTVNADKPWYKFASCTINTQYHDRALVLDVFNAGGYVTGNTGSQEYGRLYAHFRSTTGITGIEHPAFIWQWRNGEIDLANFVMAYKVTSGTKIDVELWCKCPKSYAGYQFVVVHDVSREQLSETAYWTLYNTWTNGSQAAITSGYTQVASVDASTGFITRIDDAGITVHPSGTTNNRVAINANGMQVYKGNVDVASYGDTARIGKANSSRFLMNASSLQAYNSSNAKYFEVSASGMTFGTNSVATTQNVTDAVNDISVGGRNLLAYSGTGKNWGYSTFADGVYTRSTTGTAEVYISGKTIAPLELGETYTFSAWMKTNGQVSSVEMFLYDGNVKTRLNKNFGAITTEWKFYTWTVTMPTAWVSGSSETAAWNARFDNNGSKTSGTEAILYVKQPKLEKGNKATDWTPAPEDVDASVEAAAKTATNYISVDPTGIRIADSNPATATTYQHQTATNTEFVVNGAKQTDISGNGLSVYSRDTNSNTDVSVAQFGKTARVGPDGDCILLDDGGIKIIKGADESMLIAGGNVRIGRDYMQHVNINSTGFNLSSPVFDGEYFSVVQSGTDSYHMVYIPTHSSRPSDFAGGNVYSEDYKLFFRYSYLSTDVEKYDVADHLAVDLVVKKHSTGETLYTETDLAVEIESSNPELNEIVVPNILSLNFLVWRDDDRIRVDIYGKVITDIDPDYYVVQLSRPRFSQAAYIMAHSPYFRFGSGSERDENDTVFLGRGNWSTALGLGVVAGGDYQLAIGTYNKSDSTDYDYPFVIGNGSDRQNRSNAFAVTWNGIINAGLKSGTIDINTSTIRSTSVNQIHSNGVCCSVTVNVRNNAAIANGSNIVVGTVPEGFRPPQAIYSACSASNAAGMGCYMTLGTDGTITCYNRSGSSVAANTALAATFTYAI